LIKKAQKVFESYPYDVMPIEAIRQKLRENRMNFIDIEFLPCESSIHSPNEPEKPFQEEKIVWKRPKEFMVVDDSQGLYPPEIFQKKIEPNDIKQG